MIIFANRFTQQALQGTVAHEAHQKSHFALEGYCPLRDDRYVRWLSDWIAMRVLGFPPADDRISVVELYTSPSHCLPDTHICYDFDFVLYSVPVDNYGVPLLNDRSMWHREFNGGLINHQRNADEKPEWSMHT